MKLPSFNTGPNEKFYSFKKLLSLNKDAFKRKNLSIWCQIVEQYEDN